jgi:hypothetical protein
MRRLKEWDQNVEVWIGRYCETIDLGIKGVSLYVLSRQTINIVCITIAKILIIKWIIFSGLLPLLEKLIYPPQWL